MKEVNYIIQNVSHRSLIIMDELGRGRCFNISLKVHSLMKKKLIGITVDTTVI